MKKWIALSLLFFTFFFAKADQLAYLTLEQAKKAVEYLKNQDHVIMWCACCDDDVKIYVMINRVYYQKIEGENSYYEVIIEKINRDGETVEESIDLAYIHVKPNGKRYKCLGKVLKFTCDPCTKPFKWKGGICYE